jgi:NADP-dependent 3-hydroxy acid dehydrogenase YdfG
MARKPNSAAARISNGDEQMSAARQRFGGGVAVVTGAGSGIGEGIARHAAALGMKVALADIAAARIDAIARELRDAGLDAMAVSTDVSKPEALDALAATVHEAWGDVRLLVNNAGVETMGFAWELPVEVWERTLNVNIHGVIHGVRAFAPRMIASGADCVIANLSSIGGLSVMPLQTPYILSKHAVLAFSEGLALEMLLKKTRVQVSAVLPGPVLTRIMRDAASGGDELTAHHLAAMQQMLEAAGVTPDAAAQSIFDQLTTGEFWVSTHPDMMRQMGAARARLLESLSQPSLDGGMLALLGLDPDQPGS